MTPQSATPARQLRDCAVVVAPEDNVAVVKSALVAGDVVAMPDGAPLAITGKVTPGHRFATRAVPAGEYVLQYSQPIGTSQGIGAGDPISHDNMTDDVPVVRDLPDDLSNPAPDYFEASERGTFRGFRRPDGRVGTRNWVLVVPTSMCSSHEAQQIAMVADLTTYSRAKFPNVDGVVALPHNKGCGCGDGSNIEVMLRTLRNYADHANVGAVVFIDLGCEKTNLTLVGKYLKQNPFGWDKPVLWMGIQEAGGTQAAIEKGLAAVSDMLPKVNEAQREEVALEHLVLGVKCGGSDGFSGLSANPSLGRASDLVVRSGGTVLITEVPEFCGAEHVFANRARDAEVGRAVYATIDWYKQYAAKFGMVLNENPSPGNKAGGLLNITIKSLGAMAKGGTTRVEGCIGYAERPERKGLHLMQGPGYDQESTPGLVASGANVVVFTTGRGTTIGNAICPVIKLASNTAIHERMKLDLDLSAGGVIDGTETIDEVGARVFEHVKRVASGDVPAMAEVNKHREFQFWAEETVSLLTGEMAELMRACVLTDVGRMEVRDVPCSVPGPHDVLVRVSAVGMCGTDFHIFSGEANYNLDADERPVPLTVHPQILGHEVTGVVEATGARVHDLAPGDRVSVDQGLNCFSTRRAVPCEYCATGVSHQCEYFAEHGITGLPGGFAELLAVPAINCVHIEAELDPACAAMVEPLACVLHSSGKVAGAAARYSLVATTERERVRTVLVCGAGPAGLLFVQVLRNVLGFEGRILLSEIHANKRALAEQFGAEPIDPAAVDLHEVVLEATGGRRVEYAIEATGVGAVIAALPRLIRRQATVLKYGIGHTEESMHVMNEMQWKEATFLMPAGASGGFDADGRPSVYRRALELIQSGTVDVASIVSHRYAGLDAVPDAFTGDHASAEYVKGVAVL